MAALTTPFTPSPWCSNRFAVFVDDRAPGTSIIPPTSGWVDPSFTKCIPKQYSAAYPTFSPGMCPAQMEIVKHTFDMQGGKTIWNAACCQSGFAPMSGDAEYLCTSAITRPMAFLLDPNISTADVYTTLAPDLWVVHDQVTVQWKHSDLDLFPVNVASQYKFMMDIAAQALTENTASKTKDSATTISRSVTAAEESAPVTTNHRGHHGHSLSTSVIWPTPGYSETSTAETQTQSTTTTTTTGGSYKLRKPVVSAIVCFALATYLMA